SMASWIFVLAVTLGGDQAASTERGFHDFHQQISDLLKKESQAKDNAARAAAVGAMCALHAEIVHDSRYSTSDVLKEYRGRLWSRLTKVKAELKTQLARSKSNKESLENLAALESADSASVAAADSLATSLAMLDQMQSGPG